MTGTSMHFKERFYRSIILVEAFIVAVTGTMASKVYARGDSNLAFDANAKIVLLPDSRNARFQDGKLPAFRQDGQNYEGGYIDQVSRTFNPVVQGEWVQPQPFSNGRAVVEYINDGKFKRILIDTNLNTVASIKPDTLLSFNNDIFMNMIDSDPNFTDSANYKNPIAVAHSAYANFDYFSGGVMRGLKRSAIDGKFTQVLIDKNGVETLIDSELKTDFYNGIAISRNNELIDLRGKIVNPMKLPYPVYNVSRFSEGLALVTTYDGNRRPWAHQAGFVDLNGNFVIPEQFPIKSGSRFQEGVATATVMSVASPYPIEIAETPTIFNKNGEVVGQLSTLESFSLGVANFFYPTLECHGTPGEPQDPSGDGPDGFCDIIVPSEDHNTVFYYPHTEYEPVFNDGLIRVFKTRGSGWSYLFHGFADKTGKIVISAQGHNWSMVRPFSEGLAMFRRRESEETEDKWGFIDRNGTEVIKPIYDSCAPFSGGEAICQRTVNSNITYLSVRPDGTEGPVLK